jgi:hypothetical protein
VLEGKENTRSKELLMGSVHLVSPRDSFSEEVTFQNKKPVVLRARGRGP